MMTIQSKSIQIFIADDQPQVRSALRFLLENQDGDWNVAGEAVDYNGLLDAIQQAPADLILLDWELPGLIGRQPGNPRPDEQIQRLRSGRTVQIVAISGYSEALEQAAAAGADAFISKSDPPDRFLDRLKNAVGVATRRR